MYNTNGLVIAPLGYLLQSKTAAISLNILKR